jgi:glutamate synthase (NADPH/NADH) small chain
MNVAIDMTPVHETTMKDTGLRPRVDYGRCCWCGLCVDVCGTSSLGLSDCYVWIDSDADSFRYTPGVEAKPWDSSELGWRKQKKVKTAA